MTLMRSLLAGILLVFATPGWAQLVDPPVRSDWCSFAEKSLLFQNGAKFSCSEANPRNLRCIKMNNYGCLQQPRSAPFNGTTWGPYKAGARDRAGHAIFEDPVNSVIGIMNVYLRYVESGTDTAISIAERYSPWCDTLGTVERRQAKAGNSWRQSCRGERRGQGEYVCSRPADGITPRPGQCEACNCPSQVASRMLSGTGLTDVRQPLKLFDADSRPTALLLRIISNKMVQEMGFRPDQAFLSEASSSFVPQRW